MDETDKAWIQFVAVMGLALWLFVTGKPPFRSSVPVNNNQIIEVPNNAGNSQP